MPLTYELIRPLGSGGMGEVWLATEVHLRRKVALKLRSLDLTRDTTRVTRFEQEALNHPNVCTILALTSGGPYSRRTAALIACSDSVTLSCGQT